MSDPVKLSKSGQYWMLAFGLFFISVSLMPGINYVTTGIAEITIRHRTYSGLVAAFTIVGFLVSGFVIAISALRNIRK
jgi:3-dehydroquinate dehydratase